MEFDNLFAKDADSKRHHKRCKCKEKEVEKWSFDLRRGEAITYREVKTNSISTKKFNWLTFVPVTLLNSFMRPGNLYYLVISLIMLINDDLSPFYSWIFIFQLGFFILVYILKETILDFFRMRRDSNINDRATRIGDKSQTDGINENVKWKDIKVGDIVYLRKGEICPADIILLDSNELKDKEAICYVDMGNVTGKTHNIRKKSSSLTQLLTRNVRKNKFNEYRKMLTGKIEYESPNSNLDKFIGYLKLKKDPKVEKLTIENFIPRGAILRHAGWIFGLVVYTGPDTKIMKNAEYKIHKKSFAERTSHYYIYLGFFVVFLFAIISAIVLMARSKDLKFILEYDPTATDAIRIFTYLILYSPIIPIGAYGCLDIVLFFNKFMIEKQAMKYSAPDQYFKVNDPNSLANLGQIEYIFLDKTGTITTRNYQVEEIFINNKLYGFDNKSINHLKTYYQEKRLKTGASMTQKAVTKTGDFNLTSKEDTVTNTGSNQKESMSEFEFRFTDEKVNFLPLKDFGAKDNVLKLNGATPSKFDTADKSERIDKYEKIDKPERTDTESSRELMTIDSKMHLNFQPNSHKYKEKDFLNDLQSGDDYVTDLVKAFSLCHNARINTIDGSFDSARREEVNLLEFAKLCDFNFEMYDKDEFMRDLYYVKSTGVRRKYEILAMNSFSYSRGRFSIAIKEGSSENQEKYPVIKEQENENEHDYDVGSTLYCKGSFENMRPVLDLDPAEIDYLEETLQDFSRQGLKPIIFAKRDLTKKETEETSKKYQNLKFSLMSQNSQLEELAIEMESKLKLVGIIGLRDDIVEGACEMLDFFREINSKVWLLSGDGEGSTLSCAKTVGMINSMKNEGFYINHENQEDLLLNIRNILREIKVLLKQEELEKLGIDSKTGPDSPRKIKKAQTNFLSSKTLNAQQNSLSDKYLVVNGNCLDLIFDNQYLKTHFNFIISVIPTIIGYNLNPKQKGRLVKIVQTKFYQKPVVMAIGDGYNDALMMQNADISFEIVSKSDKGHYKIMVNAGDIMISHLSQIRNALLFLGKPTTEKLDNLMHFIFYKSFMVGIPLFLFNWYSSFTGTTIHDSMFLFLYQFLFSTLSIIMFGLYYKCSDKFVLNRYPALYLDGIIKKRKAFSTFIMKSVIESTLQGVFVYYMSIYIVNNSINSVGQRSDIGTIALEIIYNLILIVNFKILALCLMQKIKKFLLVFPVSVLLVIFFVLANEENNFGDYNFKMLTWEIFDRSETILGIILVVACCLLLTVVFEEYLYPMMDPSLYQKFGKKNYKGNEFTNRDIRMSCSVDIPLGSLIKNIFQKAEIMDNFVQELLNPADLNVNELKLKKYTLKFLEKQLEKKYLLERIKKTTKYFKLIFILVLFIYGFWSLGDTLNDVRGATDVNSDESEKSQVYGFVRLGVFFGFLVLGIYLLTRLFEFYYYKSVLMCLVLGTSVKIAFDWWQGTSDIVLGAVLLNMIVTINFNLGIFPMVSINIIYLIIFFIRLGLFYKEYIIKALPGSSEPIIPLDEQNLIKFYILCSIIILISSFAFICCYLNHKFEKMKRNDYLAKVKLEIDRNTREDILSILVPKFVKDSMNQGIRSLQEEQNDVTILFCDIYDFDKIMKIENKRIVEMLDNLFRIYDNLCITHGVQKIETVGKTYMACTGIKATEHQIPKHILSIDKTRRIINMAFDMMKQVEQVTYNNGQNPIKIKIGVHNGPVIAGVIGHHKPQFSLIGDTVNTTSRLCSTGEAGKIIISESVYNKMKGGDLYFQRFEVEAKGKGTLITYHVSRESRFKKKVGNALANIKKMNKTNGPLMQVNTKKIPEAKTMGDRSNSNVQDVVSKYFQKKHTTKKGEEDEIQIDIGVDIINKKKPSIKPGKKSVAQPSESQDDVYVDDQDDFEDDDKITADILRPNPLLVFRKSQETLVSTFHEDLRLKNINENKNLNFLMFTIYVFHTLILISARKYITNNLEMLLLRGAWAIGIIFSNFFLSSSFNFILAKIVILLFFIGGFIITAIQINFAIVLEIEVVFLIEFVFIYQVGSSLSSLAFIDNLILACSAIVIIIPVLSVKSMITIPYMFFFFTFLFINLLKFYYQIKYYIKSFNNLQINESKRIEQEALVSQLLPTHAFEKLKNIAITNKLALTDEFYDVTLLYADIAGFTKYSSSVTPSQVVIMLRNLFTEFDKSCLKYRVYKVYTIGDCYVVMGFTNATKRNPVEEAKNVVKMGLSMIDIIRNVRNIINFHELDMRIGIHTGTVIGGIIGTDIVRYDIYGADVSIANKMESNGVEGNVMVSEATKLVMERDKSLPYRFEWKRNVDSKSSEKPIPGYILYEDHKGEAES